MIDYVVGGEFLVVHSSKGAMPYINMSGTQPMVGALSYDSNNQNMKVFDGNSWQTIGGGSATVNLSPTAIATLQWAQTKMFEEQENIRLAEHNPTVKSLVDEINKYKNQLEMVKILMKDEVTV